MDITLAGGSIIFAIFMVLYTAAVIHGLYSRKGSGIAEHPFRSVYSNAPGAGEPKRHGRDREVMVFTRGTR